MRVSFYGLKNIGYTQFSYKSEHQTENDEPISPDLDYENHFLSVKLTDDKDGNDLSEYLKLIKNKPQFLNIFNNQTLVFNVNKRYEPSENSDIYYPEYDFQLNGEELEVNDSNLKLFGFMSKILKSTIKASENKPKKNITNNDIFEEYNASNGCQKMFGYIQDIMENYFKS